MTTQTVQNLNALSSTTPTTDALVVLGNNGGLFEVQSATQAGAADVSRTYALADSTKRAVRIDDGARQADWSRLGASTEDATGWLRTAIAATAPGEVLMLPNRTINLSDTIDASGRVLVGYGRDNTVLQWSELGTTANEAQALILQPPLNGAPVARDFTVRGPGEYALGQQISHTNGVIINEHGGIVERLRVLKFHKNMSLNSHDGHTTHIDVEYTNGTFGLWFLRDDFDHEIRGGLIDGNTVANIATYHGASISLRATRVHCGHAPFAFYQSTAPAGQTGGQFILTLHADEMRFEEIGNGIIYSANDTFVSQDIVIKHPGFKWNDQAATFSTYAANYPRLQAIRLGVLQGYNDFGPDVSQIVGDGAQAGAIRISNLQGVLRVGTNPAADVTQTDVAVDSGYYSLLIPYGGSLRGKAVINPGELTVAVNTHLKMPVEAVQSSLTTSLLSAPVAFSSPKDVRLVNGVVWFNIEIPAVQTQQCVFAWALPSA